MFALELCLMKLSMPRYLLQASSGVLHWHRGVVAPAAVDAEIALQESVSLQEALYPLASQQVVRVEADAVFSGIPRQFLLVSRG